MQGPVGGKLSDWKRDLKDDGRALSTDARKQRTRKQVKIQRLGVTDMDEKLEKEGRGTYSS